MAQKNCADNGRTTSTYEGGGPFCVNPWAKGKDNGGATAQGVTATTVKIIAYAPNEQMMTTAGEAAPTNQATGGKSTAEDVMRDWQKAYDAVQAQYGPYQLWGRQPVVEVFMATGADETAQRADALAVIAKKPFMVFDLTATAAGGAAVFSTLLAQKKIVAVSPSTDASNSAEQSPYRWNFGADPSSGPALVAALMGKSLQGKKAEWAGDTALASKTRSFGVIYPTTGFDLPAFEGYLSDNGAKVAEKVAYDPTNAASGSTTISTLVSKLKSSGITSVTLFATPTVVGVDHDRRDRTGLLPRVDLHRVRLPGVRPVRARQRPEADGARVRARDPRTGRHDHGLRGCFDRDLPVVLGNHAGQHVDERLGRVHLHVQRAALHRPDPDRGEPEEGTVRGPGNVDGCHGPGLRQDGRAALRRVRLLRIRSHPHLVGREAVRARPRRP